MSLAYHPLSAVHLAYRRPVVMEFAVGRHLVGTQVCFDLMWSHCPSAGGPLISPATSCSSTASCSSDLSESTYGNRRALPVVFKPWWFAWMGLCRR